MTVRKYTAFAACAFLLACTQEKEAEPAEDKTSQPKETTENTDKSKNKKKKKKQS